jgi:hypothetical protein
MRLIVTLFRPATLADFAQHILFSPGRQEATIQPTACMALISFNGTHKCAAALVCACVCQVPCLNLGPQTGFPNWRLPWFASVPPGEFQGSAVNEAIIASFHIPSKSSFYYHTIRSYKVIAIYISK